MRLYRTCVFLALCVAAGCAGQDAEPQFRSYDLKLTHPTRYATYITVAPGTRDARMPRFRELDSRAFSRYLRESIGCVYDTRRDIFPLGSKRVPAGYVVPITCIAAPEGL